MTVRPPFPVLCRCWPQRRRGKVKQLPEAVNTRLRQPAEERLPVPDRVEYYLSGQEAFMFLGKTAFFRKENRFSKDGSDKAPLNHVSCQ